MTRVQVTHRRTRRPARGVPAIVALLMWLIGLGPFLHAHAGPAAITGWHLPQASAWAASGEAIAPVATAARAGAARLPDAPAVGPDVAIPDARHLDGGARCAAPGTDPSPDASLSGHRPVGLTAGSPTRASAAAPHALRTACPADLLPGLPNAPPTSS